LQKRNVGLLLVLGRFESPKAAMVASAAAAASAARFLQPDMLGCVLLMRGSD
jgi:hypothetical protein